MAKALPPKANLERFLIAGLGAVAGYMLCGAILKIFDPFTDASVIGFFSVVTGTVFAAIAWHVA